MTWKPEHQSEIPFLKRRIRVDNFGWHVVLNQRYVKSLLDAMAIIIANRWPLLQESSQNVADSTENWIHKNIERSDQVLESVSI